jgi:hypothetical protein
VVQVKRLAPGLEASSRPSAVVRFRSQQRRSLPLTSQTRRRHSISRAKALAQRWEAVGDVRGRGLLPGGEVVEYRLATRPAYALGRRGASLVLRTRSDFQPATPGQHPALPAAHEDDGRTARPRAPNFSTKRSRRRCRVAHDTYVSDTEDH